jgi:hypothetical protein
MTFGLSGAAIAGLAIGGATIYAANKSAGAARDASQAQVGAAQSGIDEQRREFDLSTQTLNDRYQQLQKLLSPFVTAGNGALTQQQNLLGLNGAQAQQGALDAVQSMPYFQGLVKQGEDGILANASATGGLRGGNVQGALAQFRPNMLAQMIQQQFANLGGISGLGENAAAFTGNAGVQTGQGIASGALQTGQGIAGLLGQQGAALAGGAMAGGRAAAGVPNALLTGFGLYNGLGGSLSTNPAAVPGAVQPTPPGAIDNHVF